jgi:hypothetical protein
VKYHKLICVLVFPSECELFIRFEAECKEVFLVDLPCQYGVSFQHFGDFLPLTLIPDDGSRNIL